jgi:hypothetical protein
MKCSFGLIALLMTLAACRDYRLDSRLTDQSGLVPPDRFARYGAEQAEVMAIAREYGEARGGGSSTEDAARAADVAVGYARTLPDVRDVRADPLGLRNTIRFKSGWRTTATPIDDGKRGSQTPGLPAAARRGTGR